jgi:hypothetical protein
MKFKELTSDHVRQPFIFVRDIENTPSNDIVPVYVATKINGSLAPSYSFYAECVNMYTYKTDIFSFTQDDFFIMDQEIRFLQIPCK